MSLQDITIHRDLQIINKYVQLPPNEESDKTALLDSTALSALSDSEIVRLSLGSGRQTGAKFGQQSFLRLPGIRADQWYAQDPVETLEASI